MCVETSKVGSDLTSAARLLERDLNWEATELLEVAEVWTVLGTECGIVREGWGEIGEIIFCAFLAWSAYERGGSSGVDEMVEETIRRQRKYWNWSAQNETIVHK